MATKKKQAKKVEKFAQFPSKQGRAWLVTDIKDGTDSYIRYSVTAEEYNSNGLRRWGDAILKVADCNRIVTLGFECNEKGLRKLRILIQQIAQFEQDFQDGIKFVNAVKQKEVVKDE